MLNPKLGLYFFLEAEERKLLEQHNEIFNNQTIQWEGKETHVMLLTSVSLNLDRSLREKVWRLASDRLLSSQTEFVNNWAQLVPIRHRLAQNIGFEDFRAYKWLRYSRDAYSLDKALAFVKTTEKIVVPALGRIYERWRQVLGVDSLRPWDVFTSPIGGPWESVNPTTRSILVPFTSVGSLEEKIAKVFDGIDPLFGHHFEIMRKEKILDLEPRSGKPLGAAVVQNPDTGKINILMNVTRIHGDITELIHEAGHISHGLQVGIKGKDIALEFSEAIAFTMQLLAGRHLENVYPPHDVATIYIQHFEWLLEVWVFVAFLFEFECWVYANPDSAVDPLVCSAKWEELWDRFIPGIDWGGLEDIKLSNWQWVFDSLHDISFYGIAHIVGVFKAIQIWQQSLSDYEGTLAKLKYAMTLDGTQSLPELFAAAGVDFDLGEKAVRDAVGAVEGRIEELMGEE